MSSRRRQRLAGYSRWGGGSGGRGGCAPSWSGTCRREWGRPWRRNAHCHCPHRACFPFPCSCRISFLPSAPVYRDLYFLFLSPSRLCCFPAFPVRFSRTSFRPVFALVFPVLLQACPDVPWPEKLPSTSAHPT